GKVGATTKTGATAPATAAAPGGDRAIAQPRGTNAIQAKAAQRFAHNIKTDVRRPRLTANSTSVIETPPCFETVLRYAITVCCASMGGPKEHGDDTRAALLEHAGRLLQAEGAEALSLRRLAEAVGTTTRAVYTLFGGKDGLLSEMYQEMGDTLTQLHEAVPEQADVVDELKLLCLAYRESARRHPSLYPMIVGGTPGFRPTADDEQQARRGFVRVLTTLKRGVKTGLFPGRRASDMGYQLWA